jgi:hypothetical protein
MALPCAPYLPIGLATVAVGALLTKKKLKCQTCGEYNDAGSAKPYDGPASRKWRKAWEKSEAAKTAAQREIESRGAETNAKAIEAALVAAADERATRGNEYIELDATTIPAIDALGSGPPPAPAWRTDPSGRHDVRYWDGGRWTEHVSDQGVQSTDAPD